MLAYLNWSILILQVFSLYGSLRSAFTGAEKLSGHLQYFIILCDSYLELKVKCSNTVKPHSMNVNSMKTFWLNFVFNNCNKSGERHHWAERGFNPDPGRLVQYWFSVAMSDHYNIRPMNPTARGEGAPPDYRLCSLSTLCEAFLQNPHITLLTTPLTHWL